MTHYVLHFDDISWGAYEFPVNTVMISADPTCGEALSTVPFGHFRQGRDSGDNLRAFGPITRMIREGRNVPEGYNVYSWLRLLRFAAPLALFQALPRFWTSRFPLTKESRPLTKDVTPTIPYKRVLDKRLDDRALLTQHAQSLQNKTWALRYHRTNLRAAICAAQASTVKEYELIRASAEYNAMDACIYSFLEELALVISLMHRMSGQKPLPFSFHDLHKLAVKKDKSVMPAGLRRILIEADWFHGFHARRSNTTHGFASFFHLPPGRSEPYIFQHPKDRDQPATSVKAQEDLNRLLDAFDRFVEDIAVELLSYFHPWDTATFTHLDNPTSERQESVVWVRHLLFSSDRPQDEQGWVLLDSSGRLQFRVDSQGILHPGVQASVELFADETEGSRL